MVKSDATSGIFATVSKIPCFYTCEKLYETQLYDAFKIRIRKPKK